jgi:hypothetical protein
MKLFRPWPPKRVAAPPEDPAASLSTPEDVKRSLEADYALGIRALREKAENAARSDEVKVDRERFDLRRQKVYLAVELLVIAAALFVAASCWHHGESPTALLALGAGAGWGGIAGYVRHRSKLK